MNIAQSPEDLRAKATSRSSKDPTSFRLAVQLSAAGPHCTPMAASEVVLKIHAADGENGLPPHPNGGPHLCRPAPQREVLWAEPRDTHDRQERRRVTTRYVLLVQSGDEEPLVVVRIGAAAFGGVDRHGSSNPDGSEMRVDSVENKQTN